jgi:hypothetical protein
VRECGTMPWLFSGAPLGRALSLRPHPATPRVNSASPRLAPLETLAREVYALFPRCVRCGERVACFEEADVRIFSFRVLHRADCTAARTTSP